MFKALQIFLEHLNNSIWSFPFLIFLFILGIFVFFATYAAPFRFFISAWKYIIFPDKNNNSGEMSSFQAFINSIGASIGNGSIAGLATAIHIGGPGAIFWVLLVGFLSMSWRFAEVYLSTYFIGKATFGTATGGPIVYLSKVPGGNYLPYIFTFICIIFSLMAGNMMQANSIAIGLENSWQIPTYLTALIIFVFVFYAVQGQGERILKISDRLVPFKVLVFFTSAVIVLFYHISALPAAIKLIFVSALNPSAALGGTLGYSVQQAMSEGFNRGISGNEGGLGTSALFFGSTSGKDPIKDSMLSMLGVFLTTHVIGLLMMLTIITSGAWTSELTSTALSIAAFNTVFGKYGGWIITFSAASFGLSVIVSYAFLVLQCWKFLTNNRGLWLYKLLYIISAFLGCIMTAPMVWSLVGITNAILLLINLFGILWLIGIVRNGVAQYLSKS
ncbi:MAG TPA: amino acid carrier protein [Candidatus Babeliales bacterium]|nr:amino acid carrier protein [Candidatus Babeliales bacterium]